jgi:antitoxin (DNA-binding transcriptional repressor) of toxin-antitoxin stability system
MPTIFRQIPISELRPRLAKLKRQVQLGYLRMLITCYGEVVGFLVPIDDVEGDREIPINEFEEVPLTKFRDNVNEYWMHLQAGVDVIYLTFHTRRVIAFVSPRLGVYLPIPITKDSERIFTIIDNSKIPNL